MFNRRPQPVPIPAYPKGFRSPSIPQESWFNRAAPMHFSPRGRGRESLDRETEPEGSPHSKTVPRSTAQKKMDLLIKGAHSCKNVPPVPAPLNKNPAMLANMWQAHVGEFPASPTIDFNRHVLPRGYEIASFWLPVLKAGRWLHTRLFVGCAAAFGIYALGNIVTKPEIAEAIEQTFRGAGAALKAVGIAVVSSPFILIGGYLAFLRAKTHLLPAFERVKKRNQDLDRAAVWDFFKSLLLSPKTYLEGFLIYLGAAGAAAGSIKGIFNVISAILRIGVELAGVAAHLLSAPMSIGTIPAVLAVRAGLNARRAGKEAKEAGKPIDFIGKVAIFTDRLISIRSAAIGLAIAAAADIFTSLSSQTGRAEGEFSVQWANLKPFFQGFFDYATEIWKFASGGGGVGYNAAVISGMLAFAALLKAISRKIIRDAEQGKDG